MSPPPLPPRHSRSRSDTVHLTPSEPDALYGRGASGGFHDPRSSSTQSLLPEDSPAHHDPRRTLLLVFVHGFMGDETSFQSFPAHLHNVVTLTLSETHAVHTKIYPRYRSRRRLEYATEEFSKWLQPHLGPDTDVILLGHSMGGLLTADVVLLPGASPQPLRHRILGTISFDTPFLGMHPGVIKSGLSSIFRPAPEKSPERQPDGVASPPPRINTLFSTNPSDPNYNPSFQNDVILPVRKGWSNTWHFVNKHSDSLVTASKQLVKSHLEFGGAMADYNELKRRYKRIRALEEEDETKRQAAIQGRPSLPVPRVRFINFYTASTGRPKPVKSGDASPNRSMDQMTDVSAGMSQLSLTSSYQDSGSLRSSLDPSLNSPPGQEDMARDTVEYLTPYHSRSESASPRCSGDMQQMSPRPLSEADSIPPQTEITPATPSSPSVAPEIKFPDVPPLPDRPVTPDLSAETDAKARKAAEKAHHDAVKAYKQAVKQHNNAVKEQEKQALKAEKEARKEEERRAKERAKEEKLKLKQTKSTSDVTVGAEEVGTNLKPPKPAKDRKFCMLPSNHASDPTWIRVFMRDVDEVGAHCGLFFVGDTYAMLVGEVAATVERWVNEDVGERWAKNAAEVGQVL
ncbi:hypothetical protein HDK64DRAFT_197277 [Phyllosticta capitalensis]